jgi:23S rRNA (guanosine2251-2'-O)-methyltransferase
VHQLILAAGVDEQGIVSEIVRLAGALDVPARRLARSQLDRIAKAHQGVALEVSGYPYADLADILNSARKRGEPPFVLALDHVQDPHNLGALLRTAEVGGLHGVIIPGRRAADVTPAVVGTSVGASEHMRVAQITNLVRTLEELKGEGLWVVGLESLPDAQPYDQVNLNLPLVLVVGAEDRGLSRLVRETCDLLIRLPVRGHIESLNASVAGGIAIYAALAARGFSEE